MTRLFFLFALWIVTIPLFCQHFIGNEADIKQIQANAKQFSTFIVNSDYDNIVASYTKDGKIFPNNDKILSGTALRTYWTLPQGTRITFHEVIPEEIKVWGDEAYDYGYYRGKTLNADGQESSWQGKYVIIWRKEDGVWKMYLDIWNRVQKPID